jgi:hypothetical protein
LALLTAASSCVVLLTLNVAALAPPASINEDAPATARTTAHARKRDANPYLILSSSSVSRNPKSSEPIG